MIIISYINFYKTNHLYCKNKSNYDHIFMCFNYENSYIKQNISENIVFYWNIQFE